MDINMQVIRQVGVGVLQDDIGRSLGLFSDINHEKHGQECIQDKGFCPIYHFSNCIQNNSCKDYFTRDGKPVKHVSGRSDTATHAPKPTNGHVEC